MQPTYGVASPGIAAASRGDIDALKAEFNRLFGEQPPAGPHPAPNRRTHVVRAPGRVNLIGEHTDYNDGFVFPMAIEPEVRIVCRGRDDGVVRLASTAFMEQVVEFSVQRKIERGEPEWANYMRGVAALLVGAGIPLTGMDALVANTLPVGSGLSSSAAIEVATAQAFLTVAGSEMDPQRMALLCQKAEHTFAQVPCGIMDQTIVAGGKAGHAMLLDCRDLSKQFVPIDPKELRVVIVNSMVKHALTGGEYAERRGQCEQAVAFYHRSRPEVKALRDVSAEEVEAAEDKLPEDVFRRCRHVVTEIARTVKAASALSQRDYDEVGRLMLQSHASLRDDYEVSTEELDLLVDEASKVRGVYRARMTGAGFGGCIVALAQPRSVDSLTERLMKCYPEQFGKDPQVYVTTATAGVGVIEQLEIPARANMTKAKVPTDIDGYIARFPADVQAILQKVRKTISAAAPEAREVISYQMPAFRQHGILVYFAAWKEHIGLYPPISGDKTLEKAVARYAGPKGNLQFPLDEPMPFGLISRIVMLRVKQDVEKKNRKRRT